MIVQSFKVRELQLIDTPDGQFAAVTLTPVDAGQPAPGPAGMAYPTRSREIVMSGIPAADAPALGGTVSVTVAVEV